MLDIKTSEGNNYDNAHSRKVVNIESRRTIPH